MLECKKCHISLSKNNAYKELGDLILLCASGAKNILGPMALIVCQQTVELIAGQLSEGLATKTATPTEKEESRPEGRLPSPDKSGLCGGADGIRTRDLRRDRPAF